MSVHTMNNPNSLKIHSNLPDALEEVLRKMAFPVSLRNELTAYARELDAKYSFPKEASINIPAGLGADRDRAVEEAVRVAISGLAMDCDTVRLQLIAKLVAIRWQEIQARQG